MTELEKLAKDFVAARRLLGNPCCESSYKEGFRKARDMAVHIWESSEHTGCEFFQDGFTMLDSLGEADETAS